MCNVMQVSGHHGAVLTGSMFGSSRLAPTQAAFLVSHTPDNTQETVHKQAVLNQ